MSRLAALLGLLAVAHPAAAIIELRHEVFLIEGSSAEHRQLLEVRLEQAADLENWREFRIFLDDHIQLLSCRAEVFDGDGALVQRVPQRQFQREESAGFGLYNSSWYQVIRFTRLETGHRLRIEVVRRHSPLFPSLTVPLLLDEIQARLRIEVHGGGGQLRWHLSGAEDLVRVTHAGEALTIEGEDLPIDDPPSLAGERLSVAPMLRLAWDDDGSWQGVGRWYSRMIASVPRGAAEVGAAARTIAAGAGSPRERLERLTEHVKHQVRYEAVEVGAGGWVPSPPQQVLERGWGDCKDKSELLAELLRAVEIPSHLVLVRLGQDAAIRTDFPSSYQFNHCIVAVPSDRLELRDGDPEVDGYLFLDPTMDRGGATWLNPFVQGQHALLVDGDRSRLLQLPVLHRGEGRVLLIDGEVSRDGDLNGMAVLRHVGVRALGWLRDLDSADPARIDEDIRRLLGSHLPGATLADLAWKEIDGAIPAFHMQASLSMPQLVRGTPGRRWLLPSLLSALPSSGVLDGRGEPVVLRPGIHHSQWRLRLPDDWCPAAATEKTVANELGTLRTSVSTSADGRLVVERDLEVWSRWIEPALFEQLAELAAAENRGNRRRIRLRCADPPAS